MTAETIISMLLALFVLALFVLGYCSWRNARRKEDSAARKGQQDLTGGPKEPA